MFDRVVVVDWSAGSRPRTGPDSIWIAVADTSSGDLTTTNPPTRTAASAELAEICRRTGSTLLGVDFSIGYPAGTAAALGLSGEPWRAMWRLLADLIVDGDDNTNNRFRIAAELNGRIGGGPGPFWGCPASRRTTTLTSTKVDAAPLPVWRLVEERLRAAGHGPFSAWQLLGAGSVGSQSLVGIPRLARLEDGLRADGRRVEVWPFGSWAGGAPAPDVVIAEIWPSLFRPPALDGRVRDEVQVIETARRLAEGPDFRLVPLLSDESAQIVRNEEGWVLGA